MQDVNQLAAVLQVVQFPPLRSQGTHELAVLADKASPPPLSRNVHPAGLGQFAGLVKEYPRFALVPPPEDVEAGQVADLAGALALALACGDR